MKESVQKFAEIVSAAVNAGTLQNVVFHTPSNRSSEVLKVKGSVKSISSRKVLQLESFLTEGRVTHDNVKTDEISLAVGKLLEGFRRADLVTYSGSATLMISKKGDRASLVTHGKLTEIPEEKKNEAVKENDRKKNRLLDGSEAFLFELGISDRNGRVRDKMQAKFRQINRFCEYISDAYGKLPADGTLYVADLCCGKSYLSFAAYHTITKVLERDCVMYCVDLKKSVIDYCTDIAEKCAFDGMKFACGDITEFVPEHRPNMVISLHACDTATDVVLECALRYGAEVILSTPCCHHELNEKLDCDALAFIGSKPLLRQKLCSAATDALRLMRLEAAGYDTDATELIDPENTPKNIMLRGYRKKNPSKSRLEAAFAEYAKAYKFMYGYDPTPLPEVYK